MHTSLLPSISRWLRLAPLATVVGLLLTPLPFDPEERAEEAGEA